MQVSIEDLASTLRELRIELVESKAESRELRSEVRELRKALLEAKKENTSSSVSSRPKSHNPHCNGAANKIFISDNKEPHSICTLACNVHL